MAKWHTIQRRKLEQKQLDEFGFNFCEICRKEVIKATSCFDGKNHNSLTADHIIPKFQGGSNSIDNIQIACFECNQKKGCKFEDPFVVKTNSKINKIYLKLTELENSL